MKTTVIIDQEKLARVMRLTGIRTRRKAIDFALDQAERAAKIMSLLEGEFYTSTTGEIVDPKYNISKMRDLDRPRRGREHSD